jgi:hypothetical protein
MRPATPSKKSHRFFERPRARRATDSDLSGRDDVYRDQHFRPTDCLRARVNCRSSPDQRPHQDPDREVSALESLCAHKGSLAVQS